MSVYQPWNTVYSLPAIYQGLYRRQWGFKEATQKFLVQHTGEVYYSVLRGATWEALVGSHRKATNPKVRAKDLMAIIVYTTYSIH